MFVFFLLLRAKSVLLTAWKCVHNNNNNNNNNNRDNKETLENKK